MPSVESRNSRLNRRRFVPHAHKRHGVARNRINTNPFHNSHFYYDLLGRILPGAYLIAGFLGIYWNQPALQSARDYLNRLNPPKPDGIFLLLSTVGLLMFVSSAYLVGFVFGALAFGLERVLGHTSPKSLDELLASFGTSKGQQDQLKEAFKNQFHFDLDEADGDRKAEGNSKATASQRLTESSSLCSYYVWAHAPNLGTMTSRWDAETIASRALFTASLILTALQLTQMAVSYLRHDGAGSLALLIVFVSVGTPAFFQYRFQRRKQIQGRFSLFQALRTTLRPK